MKKSVYLLLAMVVLGAASAVAQPRAIGGNLGTDFGFSYQHGFGQSNMLDLSVNVPLIYGIGVGGKVTYDWIDPFNAPVPWDHKGEWHWYMGVGGGASVWFPYSSSESYAWWNVGAVGHIGIEYDFWFPLQLSLDWRPQFGIGNYDYYGNGHKVNFDLAGIYGLSLGVRYKF